MMHYIVAIKMAFFSVFSNFIFSLPIRFIRTVFLRSFVRSMGKDVYVARNIDVRRPCNIILGNNIVINKHVLLDGRGGLKIGNNVDIAQDSCIWTRHHDYNDDYHAGLSEPVEIEDYVWICSRSIILPGRVVHRGAVVAAGAVVVKDVDEMSVVGGVPAKHITTRKSKLLYTLKHNPSFYAVD